MTERSLRLDLVLALVAVLVSSIAAGASVYQTFVIRQQLSATIWPYLDFSITNDPGFFDLALVNDGLGPAVVRSVTLTFDGKPYADFGQMLASRAVQLHRSDGTRQTMRLVYNTLGIGDVVPAGKSRQLLHVDMPHAAERVAPLAKRTDIAICYCSLLAQCWTLELASKPAVPQAVSQCG